MDVSVVALIYDPVRSRTVRLTIHVPETDNDMELENALSPEMLEEFLNDSLLNDELTLPPKLVESELNLAAPRTRYRKAHAEAGSSCAICIEEFRPRMYVRTLPCGHRYCSKCISKWVSQHSATCPTCRLQLTS